MENHGERSPQGAVTETAGGPAAISVRDASKWYGAVIGVNQVSLDVGPGILGLLGPNGAGKSTLMKLIAGQLRPSMGEVLVLGERVWSAPAIRRHIGFTPEADAFHEEMTGRQFVCAMGRLSGLSRREARTRTEEVLERTGMAAGGDKKLRACSKGMRQRIKIAQALVHDPQIVVLDEPLSGIDPAGRLELMGLFQELRDRGKTVIVSTHILHEIEEITPAVVLMAHGRILASGTLRNIRDLLAEYPLTVRITSDRSRALGAALVGRESVVGVSLGGTGMEAGVAAGSSREDLIVKVRRPDEFFRELPGMLVGLNVEISRVEALDASAEAIFRYLVNRPTWEGGGGGG